MAQVQTAPPPSVPWDNPFSHVTVTAAPTTDSSPQWIKDLDKKGVSAAALRLMLQLIGLVGHHPQSNLGRASRILRQGSY
jgi:hypothetical protein